MLDDDGTISAEHGVGTAKAAGYAALVALKRSLGRFNLLNAGTVLVA